MIEKRDAARMALRKTAAQVINGFDALRLKVQERGAELEENL